MILKGFKTLKGLEQKLREVPPEKRKVIVHTRNIGRAKLYKLNTEDPTVQKLVKLHWEIIKTETDKTLE